MSKLKPWYQVITPREDLRQNRPLDASEFAVHLDHIRTNRAAQDYVDPARFFGRTYMTGSLLELASQVVRRLNGIQVETSAVFNMATQFGGGKTHSLTTLYHLAKHGDAAKNWAGVNTILLRAGVNTIPKADTAVFVGTEFDVLSGRKGDGEPLRKTPWGEIAWQLGKEDSFAKVAEHDAKGIAPAGDVIREMLPSGPVVILMDELLNYVSNGRKAGARDQFYNFLQNLCEEARARNNMVLCVSIPSSDLEMNPEDERDYNSLKKLCDRTGKAILMSANQEMSEIIRRRLFEWNGLSSDAKATCEAYADWASDHAQELAGIDRNAVYEQFCACYPFHPTVISVFERKWQSLARFQRTRGVLRLLALWVASNYNEDHRKASKEPLITLGLAPLENPLFRSALFEQLGSNELEVPVTADIAGKASDSHSLKLDNEASEAIKKAQLHRKVATTIFFESNGGQSQNKMEASLSEIKTGVCGPDFNTADVDTVVESLASTCFYLQWEKNRFRFGLAPNLNQILVARRGDVKSTRIEERLRQRTDAIFRKKGSDATRFIEVNTFPKRSSDILELPKLTIVAMSLDQLAEEKSTEDQILSMIRDAGNRGRTFKSALIFAAADQADDLHAKAREALAWEDVDDDEETRQRVDEGQKSLLRKNLANAKRDLDEAIFRSYKHLYFLDKENKLRHVDLAQITSSSAPSLIDVYLERLGKSGLDEIVDTVPARRLEKYWPAAMTEWSTKSVRDAFYSSPLLPRLLNPATINRTIADGVAQGLLGYAIKDAGGNLRLNKLKESLLDADVEISDDVFILKAEDAQKLREPPKLVSLKVRPDVKVIKPGEQISFECIGMDQYGQPIAVAGNEWSASVGNVTSDGLFTSPSDAAGSYLITANVGSHKAVGEVRITPVATGGSSGSSNAGKTSTIRWSGEVPAQKWMNFYTKVLSRLANQKALKVTVSIEASVEPESTAVKADEIRVGLGELGLDSKIEG